MYSTRTSQDGSYRFIPAVYQYSGGVAAEPGFRIERAQLVSPVPLDRGLRLIEAHLKQAGRPLIAFCACELRSPEPFSEGGFDAFNRLYASRLDQWGILQGQVNPVARTNICPEIGKPDAVSLHAFSYTVPHTSAQVSFVVAGSGEAPEGGASYAQGTIRPGDASPEGVRAKAGWVMGGCHGREHLHGARHPSAPCRRAPADHQPRPRRDLAFLAAPGRSPRLRDGCEGPAAGDRDRGAGLSPADAPMRCRKSNDAVRGARRRKSPTTIADGYREPSPADDRRDPSVPSRPGGRSFHPIPPGGFNVA
jgi:hypothetical protein